MRPPLKALIRSQSPVSAAASEVVVPYEFGVSSTSADTHSRGQTVKAVFWISLAGVLYTYVGYPIVIWAWSKLRPRRWRSAPILPSVSVVMAVRNGMELLPARLNQLAELD